MITPDAKDWTWVLERRCEECGFDASRCSAADVADLVRSNARDWEELLREGRVRPGRPDVNTWSGLEYACHVRDVYRRYAERTILMREQDDPLFPNWDQDATADEDRYDEQDPGAVIAELQEAAEALARLLESLAADDWERSGRRSDGASFTIDTLARYMVHDPIHHVWDVRRQGPP